MTIRKTKTAPHRTRITTPKLTITAAAIRYGLNSNATFSVGADVFCRAAEHARASPPLIIGSEHKITVELPVSLAVEIGICARMLVRVQRAAYQVVFAPAARDRLRGTICQDIAVAWDGTDARMQALGPPTRSSIRIWRRWSWSGTSFTKWQRLTPPREPSGKREEHTVRGSPVVHAGCAVRMRSSEIRERVSPDAARLLSFLLTAQ